MFESESQLSFKVSLHCYHIFASDFNVPVHPG